VLGYCVIVLVISGHALYAVDFSRIPLSQGRTSRLLTRASEFARYPFVIVSKHAAGGRVRGIYRTVKPRSCETRAMSPEATRGRVCLVDAANGLRYAAPILVFRRHRMGILSRGQLVACDHFLPIAARDNMVCPEVLHGTISCGKTRRFAAGLLWA